MTILVFGVMLCVCVWGGMFVCFVLNQAFVKLLQRKGRGFQMLYWIGKIVLFPKAHMD